MRRNVSCVHPPMKGRGSIFILLAMAVYVTVYAALSAGGAFIPGSVGANGIKDWMWAPRGFADEAGRIRTPLLIAFLPLWWIDHHYLHDDWTGRSGPRYTPPPPNKSVRANPDSASGSVTVFFRSPKSIRRDCPMGNEEVSCRP